ncbi:MAG: hypothetical protein SWY16_26080 [Cyanobacteriota bacterium]|nr:hypothetical protein [Cyanobacteriota bacterium]
MSNQNNSVKVTIFVIKPQYVEALQKLLINLGSSTAEYCEEKFYEATLEYGLPRKGDVLTLQSNPKELSKK